ncbi:MAG: PAS domain S-box protein [Rhodocyclaceae bacterium]|nr:PAS domain S-box protein [Rhodocyclaceae bacterium]
MVLIALALADRFNAILKQNDAAQKEQLRAEQRLVETLRDSEARFSGVFQCMPDYVTVTRMADERIIDVNQGFEALSGWAREDAIGRSATELGLWKNTAERMRIVDTLVRDGVAKEVEARMHTKDGTLRECLVSASTFKAGDESFMVAMVRDITEAKLKDAALQASVSARQAAEWPTRSRASFWR